jgi:hypothetical protein
MLRQCRNDHSLQLLNAKNDVCHKPYHDLMALLSGNTHLLLFCLTQLGKLSARLTARADSEFERGSFLRHLPLRSQDDYRAFLEEIKDEEKRLQLVSIC